MTALIRAVAAVGEASPSRTDAGGLRLMGNGKLKIVLNNLKIFISVFILINTHPNLP